MLVLSIHANCVMCLGIAYEKEIVDVALKRKIVVCFEKAILENSEVDEEVAVENLHSPDKSYTRLLEMVIADAKELAPKNTYPNQEDYKSMCKGGCR